MPAEKDTKTQLVALMRQDTNAASFEADPAREEEQLGTVLDEITTDDFLKKLSTPGLINEAQREKNSKEVSSIIRRIMESARMKATSRQGKQKQMKFSVTFQKKFESTAAKVRCYSN
jgi:hypothetical protein